jgi:hypothetical protein
LIVEKIYSVLTANYRLNVNVKGVKFWLGVKTDNIFTEGWVSIQEMWPREEDRGVYKTK